MSSQCRDKYDKNSWIVFKVIYNLAQNFNVL
jgi:hypothetical protein